MVKCTVKDIIKATGGRLLFGDENAVVKGVSYDSRDIESGDLFVPIVGARADGHCFIASCFKSGATAALTQKEIAPTAGKSCILVRDTLFALQDLSAWYRSLFDTIIVGVTGSVGKTSTKEMIAAALSQGLCIMKTKGNRNSQIGLPATMFDLETCHKAAVIEMGISEFDEMERLCDIARPQYAVMTNIGKAHIENLKTQRNILGEKLKITNHFNSHSVLFLNGDDKLLSELHHKMPFKTVTFGFSPWCDYRAENISTKDFKTKFTLTYNERRISLEISALGVHNILNAMAAFAVGETLGLTPECIVQGLMTYQNAPMRQQFHKIGDMLLIDDSYNSSPEAVKASLDVLKSVSSGKTIAVLADMLELGDQSEKEHFEVGVYLAETGVDTLIALGNQAVYIADGARAVKRNMEVYIMRDNDSAAEKLCGLMTSGCAVLVKGSRGMHTDAIVKYVLEKYRNDE